MLLAADCAGLSSMAVFNCFPPEKKPIRDPETLGFKLSADFLLMFEL